MAYPKCIDCKHIDRHYEDVLHPYCLRPLKDPTREAVGLPPEKASSRCEWQRRPLFTWPWSDVCGRRGRFFEKRDEMGGMI